MTEKLKENRLLVGAVVAILLVFGLLSVDNVRAQVSSWTFNVFSGEFQSDDINDLKVLLESDRDLSLGAISGNELNFPEWNVNGVVHAYRSQGWTIGTSTPCLLRAPNATTTIAHLSAISNTVTSTGEMQIYVGDTQATATARFLTGVDTTKGINVEFVATTTESGEALTLSPLVFVIFDWSSATTSISGTTGSCKAEFIIL